MPKTTATRIVLLLCSAVAGCANAPSTTDGTRVSYPDAPRQRYAVVGTNASYHAPAPPPQGEPSSQQLQQIIAALNERVRYLERLVKKTTPDPAAEEDLRTSARQRAVPAVGIEDGPAATGAEELPDLGAQPVRRAPPREARSPQGRGGLMKVNNRILQSLPDLDAPTMPPPTRRPEPAAPRGRSSINQLVLPSRGIDPWDEPSAMKAAYQPPDGFRPISEPKAQEWLVIYRFRNHAAGERFARELERVSVTPERKFLVNGEYVVQVGSYHREERARLRRAFLGEHTGVLPELRVR